MSANEPESRPAPRALPGRWIYAATIVAMLSVAGGSLAANLLTPTPVTQTASFYEGGNNAVANWPTPTLSVGSSTNSICTSSLTAVAAAATPPAPVTILLSAAGPTGTCAAGNFAEIFTFAFTIASTGVSQTNTVTVTTSWGTNGPVYSNTASVDLSTPASGTGPFTATLHVAVDFGATSPPTGGISVLDLVVQ